MMNNANLSPCKSIPLLATSCYRSMHGSTLLTAPHFYTATNCNVRITMLVFAIWKFNAFNFDFVMNSKKKNYRASMVVKLEKEVESM